MYQFRSGQQDFQNLFCDGATATQNVLAFKPQDSNVINLLSLAELQNSVLQAKKYSSKYI